MIGQRAGHERIHVDLIHPVGSTNPFRQQSVAVPMPALHVQLAYGLILEDSRVIAAVQKMTAMPLHLYCRIRNSRIFAAASFKKWRDSRLRKVAMD